MRLPPLILAGAVALVGCGDDSASQAPARVQDEPCPAGTKEFAVRDVLPKAPAGMTLLRVRKSQIKQAREAFASGFGGKLRSLRVGVVAPSGRQVGTGVGVLNLTVRVDDEPAPATSQTRQPLMIAGRDGLIMVAAGGGATRASGSVGTCAVVVLNGPDEASVRRVAAAIRQPD